MRRRTATFFSARDILPPRTRPAGAKGLHGKRLCRPSGKTVTAALLPQTPPLPGKTSLAGLGTHVCPRCNTMVSARRCALGHRTVRLASETFLPRFWTLAAMTLVTPLLLWALGQALGLESRPHSHLMDVSEAAWALLALFNLALGLWHRRLPEPARRLSCGLLGAGLGILAGLAATLLLPQLVPLGRLFHLVSRIYRQ